MDLSKFSTEDLQAMKADWTKMSTSGLMEMKHQQAQMPGGLENPHAADIFDTDAGRFRSGFADQPHLGALLNKAYSAPAHDKSGDLIVKGPGGAYYKDQTNFFPTEVDSNPPFLHGGHPINWAEAHAGKALPFAGMLRGGAQGAASGPLGWLTAPPLAGLGAMIGEGARQMGGQQLGVHGPLDYSEIGKEGLEGMGAELGGKALAAIPGVESAAKWLLQKALNGGKNVIGLGTNLMSGGQVPIGAAVQGMTKPTEVRAADKIVALKKMAEEALEGKSQAGKNVDRSRGDILDNRSEVPAQSDPMIYEMRDFLHENQPTPRGTEAIPESRLGEIQNEVERELMSYVPGKPVPDTYPYSGPFYLGHVTSGATKKPVTTIGELLHYDRILGKRIKDSTYNKNAMTGAPNTAEIDFFHRLRGAIKNRVQNFKGADGNIDPYAQSLKNADNRYASISDSMDNLGALDDRARQESWLDNIFRKNKENVNADLENVAPNAYNNELKNYGAKKAFLDPGAGWGNVPYWTRRMTLGMGAGAGVGFAAPGHHGVAGAALGGVAGLLSSPRLHYETLTRGSQLLGPGFDILKNQALPGMTKIVSPWSLMNVEEK